MDLYCILKLSEAISLDATSSRNEKHLASMLLELAKKVARLEADVSLVKASKSPFQP